MELLKKSRRILCSGLGPELEYLHSNSLEFRIGTASLRDTVTCVCQLIAVYFLEADLDLSAVGHISRL